MSILLVALGSGIGGACRYLVGFALPGTGGFPWATLCVNVLGSFLIGAFGSLGARLGWSDGVRLFLTVGLCGGFTTFSTFSNESLRMIESSQWGMLAVYMTASLLAGIAAVWVGLKLAS